MRYRFVKLSKNQITAAGAAAELVDYSGGHGWRGMSMGTSAPERIGSPKLTLNSPDEPRPSRRRMSRNKLRKRIVGGKNSSHSP
jgi:hypothetical protein